MKSILDKSPSNKISGIYRIFVKVGKHEFCYVSLVDNIYGDIKEHRNEIAKHFNFSKTTNELLANYSMPEKNKMFFRFAIFLIVKYHNLKQKDIKWEILEEIKDISLADEIEQKYIEHFQCEKYGFNTTFKYLEKFVEATMHNKEGEIEDLKEKWIAQEKRIIKFFATHDQNHINIKKWFKNPTNAFILLDRGYIKDEKNYFKTEWKNFFDAIK